MHRLQLIEIFQVFPTKKPRAKEGAGAVMAKVTRAVPRKMGRGAHAPDE